MNQRLYRKLAWTGIWKNRQLYVPYLISGSVMVMVFYILAFLASSDKVNQLRGGAAITTLLICGELLAGIFSIPFLFYTSSPLMKKRKKELGLYNILGMNKGNIMVSMFWETLMAYGMIMALGLFSGILFSKAAELGLVNIMEEEVDYHIYVEWKGVLTALVLYAMIYFLIFLNSIRQIHQNNPIELLRSGSAGERPPKSRWVLAAGGMGLTVCAYLWAVRIENPREAMMELMAAAGVIIVGTYLLFVSGSVFLCTQLKKRKHYYYQTAHFVTVASLAYRMKRNGASLASICILAAAILTALVGTAGFYAGVDGIIEQHYPYDLGIVLEVPRGEEEKAAVYRKEAEEILAGMNAEVSEALGLYEAGMDAYFEEGCLDLSYDLYENAPENGDVKGWNQYIEDFVCVRILQLEDYNRICQAFEELDDGEVLIAGEIPQGEMRRIQNWDGRMYTVKKTVKERPKLSAFRLFNQYSDMMMKSVTLVVPDWNAFWDGFDAQTWNSRNEVLFFTEYNWNLDEEPDRQIGIGEVFYHWAEEVSEEWGDLQGSYYAKAEKWTKLKSLAGGVLFLAFVISGIFVFAATLVMYYKQISEGYEDQKQFTIMQKIGMTKKEIRRSINSQMLTVFALPLILAGIHLTFALPGIYQVLKASVMDDWMLLVRVAAVSFLLFAGAYTLVYFLTARTYYRIVNRPIND